ncbi:MAG: endonuclease/exonuclease/phosphatase family protein [Candidatus Marinimicrobia bacterium]|nr:endonuclease/exonuclease/phosphatase family protein [Candidatus Neomarinimicrobiota bacterium]
MIRYISLLLFIGFSWGADSTPKSDFSVMTWNIWHGGREDGEKIGPQKVIKVIKNSRTDIIAIQETYGSGELISEALGFNFLERGTNVSIMSRFPIIEDISVYHEFKCVGAIIELPNKTPLAFYSIWLPYDAEIWEVGTREGKLKEELLAACASSASDLEKILTLAKAKLAESNYADAPIIIAGDFNSMSHLDYTEDVIDQYGYVIEWPTSKYIAAAGFTDSYREQHPIVNRKLGRTWSPRFPNQQQDRIDFIYYSNNSMKSVKSMIYDKPVEPHSLLNKSVPFPSDHAALVTLFLHE